MSGDRDDADGLVWEIPSSVDLRSTEGHRDSREEVRRLPNGLEAVCGPERMSVQVVPAGVGRIHVFLKRSRRPARSSSGKRRH